MVSILVFAAAYGLARPARAELIVDQRRFPYGGQVSDTEFTDFGEALWQEVADDIYLTDSAVVRQIRWLGFYGGNFEGSIYPPSVPESMRVRFYSARAGDELPGDLVYDETFSDPHRTFTGDYVNAIGLRPEFSYWVNLSQDLPLLAGQRYWLSVSQVGIPNSRFRWESSDEGIGHEYAVRWAYNPAWQYSNVIGEDQAFTLLSVPESVSGVGLITVVLVLRRSSARKGDKREVV